MTDLIENLAALETTRKAELLTAYRQIVERAAANKSEAGDTELFAEIARELGKTRKELESDIDGLRAFRIAVANHATYDAHKISAAVDAAARKVEGGYTKLRNAETELRALLGVQGAAEQQRHGMNTSADFVVRAREKVAHLLGDAAPTPAPAPSRGAPSFVRISRAPGAR